MSLKENRVIPFSPPDITENEINNVVSTLKSGWITTGPKTKEFEKRISEFCGTEKTNCLNSATACMEMCLRMLGIESGDEVITSVYTYTASASVIHHVGAKIILVDTQKDSYEMDYEALEKAITPKTKAIIPVDIAGVICNYEKIFEIVESKRKIFEANNSIQEKFGRVIVLADAAHSFGAAYKGKKSGNIADFTSFSFHAVKNLTTAEGGALTWKTLGENLDNHIYSTINTLSLHGQTKDALSKTQLGSWEYDIISPAYKCNMTDIQAAIGLSQLERYPKLLEKRKYIVDLYNSFLSELNLELIKHQNSSRHLYLTRLINKNINRNKVIEEFSKRGIATNVHYKPLALLTAYKNLGFRIEDFPNSFSQYENEITLPLHTLLTDEDIRYICNVYKELIEE